MSGYAVRIEQQGAGYQARVHFDPSRPTRYSSRFFADSKHGGPEGAHRAAVEYLEGLGIDMREETRGGGLRFLNDPGRTTRRNKSGITGVFKSSDRRPGRESVSYWAASYRIGPDGKRRHGRVTFRFRPGLRTETEARALAARFRRQYEAAYRRAGVAGVMEFWKQWKR